MPWSGSGVFNRIYSWVTDAANGLDILADRMDQDTDDITNNGFGNCLTRDGQGFASANLPMNGFKHTNVANGTQRTDYAALGQLQDGTVSYVVLSNTADAYTGNLSPAITSYTVGADYRVLAANANTTATPTVSLNGQPATTIVDQAGNVLVSGEFNGAHTLRFDGTNMRLLNPISLPIAGNGIVVNGTAISALLHGQCRLQFTNATTITLAPYNGQYIRIAGNVYAIPPVGVALSNGGLAANTKYCIYLFNNSGTLTLEASTTGHITDATAGNIGVEIKNGDNSRSLVGMAITNASAQFQQDNLQIGVLSWFNQNVLTAQQAFNLAVASISPAAISTQIVAGCWAGQAIRFSCAAVNGNGGGVQDTANTYLYVDGAPIASTGATSASGVNANASMSLDSFLSENSHGYAIYGSSVAGNSFTWVGTVSISVMG